MTGIRQYAKIPSRSATQSLRCLQAVRKAKRDADPVLSAKTKASQALAKQRADAFAYLCTAYGLPAPTTEVRFWPKRKFRFDFAWTVERVALESEGGTLSGKSRHTSITGYKRDLEKYNGAAVRGWLVLRVRSHELCSADTLEMVREALAQKAAA